MIFERIDNWRRYPLGKNWQKAFEFIEQLTPDIEIGTYPINGDDVFAMVSEYQTIHREAAKLECHRTFTDIQMILDGEEIILVHPGTELANSVPYSPERDVEFYRSPDHPDSELYLAPGVFAVFMPGDIHAPQVAAGPENEVKKLVIKIRAVTLGG